MKEHHCHICGKIFFPAPSYAFKENGKDYCSWTCYNHRNDDKEQNRGKAVEQYTKSGTLIKTFKSVVQAADFLGGTVNEINTACENCTFYKGYLWRYKK